jgi:hypothetical protein
MRVDCQQDKLRNEPVFMHTFEAHLSLLNAQRHAEVALSLGQAGNLSVGLSAPDCVPTAVKPVSRAETVADWLDTSPDHCSPLDDY